MTMRFLPPISLLLMALFLAGCGTTTFDGNKVDYKTQSKQGPGLEVPPDLSQINKDTRAAVPKGGAINASNLQGAVVSATNTAGSSAANTVALNAAGDVRVQRAGAQRWLLVDRSAEVLWPEIKAFWADNGFTLSVDQPELGIMETEWKENRAKLPQDGLRRLLGKALDGLYSTNERDKYRTRIERATGGGTEIYIVHKGMMEELSSSQRDQFKWTPRPIDPELEIEFLRRLMTRLGGVSTQAAQQALPVKLAASAVVASNANAVVTQEAGAFSLIITDAMDQAWRRTGLSLDRTNFTVEDRDRSKGIYFVRYVQPDVDKNAPGLLARMFGAKTKESLQKYQILLTAEGQQTRVRVANLQGQVLNTPEAQGILKVLAEDLK